LRGTSEGTTLELEADGVLPATYEVEVEWACATGSEGSLVEFRAGGEVLEATVPSTGGWDRFEAARPGTLDLAGGRTKLRVVPTKKPGQAVMNLRRLTLRLVRS
jgi:hypothetical protein